MRAWWGRLLCLYGWHSWGGWCENLGRQAVGRRYRMCSRDGCGAVELGE